MRIRSGDLIALFGCGLSHFALLSPKIATPLPSFYTFFAGSYKCTPFMALAPRMRIG
jgi:hypothetical protein